MSLAVRGPWALLQRLPQGLQFILVGGAAAATHLAVVGLLVALVLDLARGRPAGDDAAGDATIE